jgi:threonine dehydrogenase-like Zn-dependent dehydrogenase
MGALKYNGKDTQKGLPPFARAAVFTGPKRRMKIMTFPVLPPTSGQALLKLLRSGICGTDVHIMKGRLPLPFSRLILGHEFVGSVVALGGKNLRDAFGQPLCPSDAVIACVAQPCGKCFNCRREDTASCLNFGVTYFRDPLDPPHFFGGFAEYLHGHVSNLVKIPRNVSLDAAAAFPCAGPTVIRAFDFAGGLKRGELVVIQGTGPVGLFATAFAASAGCTVAVIGSGANPQRMKLARQLGARATFDYRCGSTDFRVKAVRKLAEKLGRGDGADVVVEATGAPEAVPEGLQLVRTLGRYLVPGQYSAGGGVEIQPQLITFKAVKIIGSGQYKLSDIAAYLHFLSRNRKLQRSFAKCITHRFAVGDAHQALAAAVQGRSVKAVFEA